MHPSLFFIWSSSLELLGNGLGNSEARFMMAKGVIWSIKETERRANQTLNCQTYKFVYVFSLTFRI